MSDDPVMAMHEAQAIAKEKQQEIDRLKREKEELEEKLRREKEELEKKTKKEKEELEEKLRKLVLEKEIPFYTEKEFTKTTQIEKGGGGTVYKGKIKSFRLLPRLFGNDNSKEIAVKKFFWASERVLEDYKKEVDILLKHKHKNLVEMYGILWDGVDNSRYLGYVMEYFEEGSLKNVIFNPEKFYDLWKICRWIVQIGEGLQYLHGKKILHRDIKPANILVAGNILKLADFGVAKYSDSTTTAGAGTYCYMAPEVHEKGKCSPASDVYSLAITIWEIFHRTKAYTELGEDRGYGFALLILDGRRPTIDAEKIDEDIAELVDRCWQREISKRLTVKEIVDFFVEKPKEVEKTILIIGGGKNNRTAYAGMAVLSRDRTKWIEIELELPYRAAGSGAIYLNGEIYLFGGWKKPKALYKLDKNLKWIQLADMNKGRRYITNSCLEWNGDIWVFGGRDENGKYLKSVERYDPKENKWTLMADMKHARYQAAAALWNNKIIICGGWIDDTTVIKTAECYNPGDNSWIEFPSLPKANGGHSLVTYENKLILFGGGDDEATNAVWELDPQESNSKWKSLPPLKYPSGYFAGIILDQEIYAIGGFQKEDLYLSRVEIFNGERWRDGAALPYSWCFMSSMIISQTLADRLCNC